MCNRENAVQAVIFCSPSPCGGLEELLAEGRGGGWRAPLSLPSDDKKVRVLRQRYTPEELERRDAFIRAVGRLFLEAP